MGHEIQRKNGERIKQVWKNQPEGRRSIRRPRLRWKDQVKRDKQELGTELEREGRVDKAGWRGKELTPDCEATEMIGRFTTYYYFTYYSCIELHNIKTVTSVGMPAFSARFKPSTPAMLEITSTISAPMEGSDVVESIND